MFLQNIKCLGPILVGSMGNGWLFHSNNKIIKAKLRIDMMLGCTF